MNVQYKTPGVYVQEVDAFPPSIVGVETAVPVFIGYTEKAEQSGRSLLLQPVRIGSMVEYQTIFGGPYPHKFALKELTAPADIAKRDVTIGDKSYSLDITTRYFLFNSLRLFYANGGGDCYILSVGDYTAPIAKADLLKGLDAVKDVVGPTILVIPEAVQLSVFADCRDVQQQMLAQCLDRQDRVALLDVWSQNSLAAALATDVPQFRDGIASVPSHDELKYGMAYFPSLKTSIVDPTNPDEVSYANLDDASLNTVKDWLKAHTGDSGVALFNKYMDEIASAKPTDADYAQKKKKLNQLLTANLPIVVKNIYAVMAEKIGTLPPSPAMAGIYTINDATRGVWNAPANVGVAAVNEPTVKIGDKDQEDLNVPIDGLAVNAIRQFVGRGTLVWGARTLDGNSEDWRYIQVRRCLIYVEQSVKLALNQFVFAPNVAQTWVTVTSAISNFLRNLWTAGGLMGSTPAEAYTVQCGLGSTMTAQDILDGYMRVQIKLQMVHPAEFIELTFEQQMQGGAG